MKAVAFYLPQFHVIPENERIYGKGFTEWRNVTQAVPLFEGHYQPHIPHKLLGYYDLTDEKTLVLQHELAYANGITGFCYYYYNLAGLRPLEKPLKIINNSKYIQNNFCFCWDHSSWYDNKKGPTAPPFIQQVYSAKEARAMLLGLESYFANPRYIHMEDKPLLLVFAPERHPEIRLYCDIWREEARRIGFAGLCLAGVEAFVGCHPAVYGLDCMVEFAPSWRKENELSAAGEEPRRIDYIKTLRFMLAKEVPDYPRMRCAFPSWDNTPRRGKSGIVAVNTSSEAFAVMTRYMAEYTQANLPASMQYLFFNAWNEWGEGCHLEPDERYGFTFLHIVRDTLQQLAAVSPNT